jgi:hypothetical protein
MIDSAVEELFRFDFNTPIILLNKSEHAIKTWEKLRKESVKIKISLIRKFDHFHQVSR